MRFLLGWILVLAMGLDLAHAYDPLEFLDDRFSLQIARDHSTGRPVELQPGKYLAKDRYGRRFMVEIPADGEQGRLQQRAKVSLSILEHAMGIPSSGAYPMVYPAKTGSKLPHLGKLREFEMKRAIATRIDLDTEKAYEFAQLETLYKKNPSVGFAHHIVKSFLPSAAMGSVDPSKSPKIPSNANPQEIIKEISTILGRLEALPPSKLDEIASLISGLNDDAEALVDFKEIAEDLRLGLVAALEDKPGFEGIKQELVPTKTIPPHVWIPEPADFNSIDKHNSSARAWKMFFSPGELESSKASALMFSSMETPQNKSYLVAPSSLSSHQPSAGVRQLPPSAGQAKHNAKTLIVLTTANNKREEAFHSILQNQGAPIIRLSERFIMADDISRIEATAERLGVERIIFANAPTKDSMVTESIKSRLTHYQLKLPLIERSFSMKTKVSHDPLRQTLELLGAPETAQTRQLGAQLFGGDYELTRSGFADHPFFRQSPELKSRWAQIARENLGELKNGAPLLVVEDWNLPEHIQAIHSQLTTVVNPNAPQPVVAGFHESATKPGYFDFSIYGDYQVLETVRNAIETHPDNNFNFTRMTHGNGSRVQRWVLEGMSHEIYSQLRPVIEESLRGQATEFPETLHFYGNKMWEGLDTPRYIGECPILFESL